MRDSSWFGPREEARGRTDRRHAFPHDRVRCQNTYLKEENLVLRQQLGGGKLRFTDDQRRRLAVKGRVLGRRVLDELAGLVTPDTILRWYRELIAAKYDGTARRGAGRPGTASSLRELVVRFATDNPTWGYTRIRDEF